MPLETGTTDTSAGTTPDTSVQPQAGAEVQEQAQQTGPVVDLDSILANPQLVEELNRRLVKPAISKVEFNRKELEASIRQQIATEENQRQQAALVARAESGDKDAIAELGRLTIAQYKNQSAGLVRDQERKDLERTLVMGLAKDLFGVEPGSIPEDAFQNSDALSEFFLTKSPRGRAKLEAMLKQVKGDADDVQAAQDQASFGAKLQQTPSPVFGTEGSVSGGVKALTQDEFDKHRKDPAWVKKNLPRLRDSISKGAIRS